jgi:hypothetical protein
MPQPRKIKYPEPFDQKIKSGAMAVFSNRLTTVVFLPFGGGESILYICAICIYIMHMN